MNIDEFLKKAEADDKLANEFKAAASADRLNEFFKSHSIDTTKEDFLKYVQEYARNNTELSDEELDAVAGGNNNVFMLFTAKLFCANH
jgi:predicted ribosomally synthesized peptide with nif11-like leader